MKKLTVSLAVLGMMVLSITGCSGIDKTVYEEKIQRVELGMQKEKFKELFPSAVPRAGKQYAEGVVEVLEVDVRHYSFYPTGAPERNPLTGNETRPRWFYFYEAQLVQYGKPDDWPKNPDEIIELRIR